MIVESILLCDSRESANRVYGNSVKSRIEQQIGVTQVFTKADVLAKPKAFSKTRFIFSTWGMPKFTEEEISVCFPSLECIFYAAGTVQAFARPFLQRGVRIVSAWAANAVPVAEVTVSQIILANKGYFAACPAYSQNTPHPPVGGIDSIYPGSFDTLVGIIGAGKVGSLVIRMLQAHRLKVLVYDPFLSAKRSQELGAEPASLERIFSECQVISNHMANNAQTVGMLNKKLFSLMRPTATFINTGRGAQVVEEDLVQAMQERPYAAALLDVTYPEPPEADSLLYRQPNIFLSPHLADSSGNEVMRMAEYVLDEYDRMQNALPLRYEVTMDMLNSMA